MSRKSVLQPYVVYNESAAAASFTTDPTDVKNLDQIVYQIEWSAGSTPDFDIVLQGTFSKEINGVTDTWIDLGVSPAPKVSGSSGNHLIIIAAEKLSRSRLSFTRNSGSATIKVTVFGKVVGA